MERYYDGDQEALFKTAHVINPYLKPKRESKVTTENFVYLFTHTNRANDLHTHLDSLSIVRAVVWKILSSFVALTVTSGKNLVLIVAKRF